MSPSLISLLPLGVPLSYSTYRWWSHATISGTNFFLSSVSSHVLKDFLSHAILSNCHPNKVYVFKVYLVSSLINTQAPDLPQEVTKFTGSRDGIINLTSLWRMFIPHCKEHVGWEHPWKIQSVTKINLQKLTSRK